MNNLPDIVVKIICGKCSPESIYLFGSHARGDFSIESDWDFYVICDSISTEAKQEILEQVSLIADCDIVFRSSIEATQGIGFVLFRRVLKEGICLFGRSDYIIPSSINVVAAREMLAFAERKLESSVKFFSEINTETNLRRVPYMNILVDECLAIIARAMDAYLCYHNIYDVSTKRGTDWVSDLVRLYPESVVVLGDVCDIWSDLNLSAKEYSENLEFKLPVDVIGYWIDVSAGCVERVRNSIGLNS